MVKLLNHKPKISYNTLMHYYKLSSRKSNKNKLVKSIVIMLRKETKYKPSIITS